MERARSRNGYLPKHSAPHRFRAARTMPRALRWTALVAGLTAAGAIHAIGLDQIAQQSGLGEPLRLVIPVLSTADDPVASDEFAGECFKVVTPVAGDLPQLNSARVALEHRGGRAFVVLTTAYPINEPIMRVAVQAGCRASVSREYTVLFDPIVIEPPIAEKATEMPAAAAAAAAVAAEPAAVSGAAAALTVPESHRAPSVASPRKHATGGAGSKQNATLAQPGRVASSSPVPVRAAKASTRPRLQVSRTVEDASTAPGSNAAQTSAAEREALRTIEEQTVVLQRQIAELSVAMERMQQELVAARAAKVEAEKNARAAAERAAAAAISPWAAMRTWAGLNWPLLVLIPGVIVLVAAALHRRRPILVPAPITPAQAAAFNRADLGEPSVPGPEALRDEEVVVTSRPLRTGPHVIPPVFVDPSTPSASEYKHDPGIAFDDDVRQTAEAASAYSILEREQPGIVGRLTESWGTPRAAAQLENYLLTPRHGGRELSRSAIEELKLLRSIALEHADADAEMLVRLAHAGNGQLRLGGT